MLWGIHGYNIEKPEGTARNYYKNKDENFKNLLVKSTKGKAVRIYMAVVQAM